MLDTANYNDVLILNGGVRFDDYNIKVNGWGSVNGGTLNAFGQQQQDYGMPNFNLGLTLEAIAERKRLRGLRNLVEPGRRGV